jgi:hypothetical protein
MGRPKKLTKARRANILKAVNHRSRRIAEDRALREARNGETASEAVEEDEIWIGSQEEWGEIIEEEVSCQGSDSSSVVCLDRGDEEDIRLQKPVHLNMLPFKGIENWQEQVAEKSASSKRPRHYTGRSLRTMYRGKSAAKKNGQTLDDMWRPVVSSKD